MNPRILLIAPILLFQSCFSIMQCIELNPDGSGTVASAVKGDGLAVTYEKLQTFPNMISGANVTRTREINDGSPLLIEEASFGSLSELNRRLGHSEISSGAQGEKTFTHRIKASGNRGGNHDDAMMVLQGQSYVMIVDVPGRVITAHPVKIGGQTYYPDRENRSITWSIPMPVFLECDASGIDIYFHVDYVD